MSSDDKLQKKSETPAPPNPLEPKDLSLEEFSIVELEDRLEFLVRSENRSNRRP